MLDAKLERLIDDEPSNVQKKNIVREQKQQEAKKLPKIKSEQVQDQKKLSDARKTWEIRKQLGLSEEKESKKEKFERQIEEKRESIQEKLALLEDPEWVNEIMSNKKELLISKEKIDLETELRNLDSYQEMKKRTFWKHTFDEFKKIEIDDNPLASPTFGAASGFSSALMAATIGAAGITAPLAPALAVGAGIGVTLAIGMRTLNAMVIAHRKRKWAKEDANLN